jgi:membrane protease YdiL (CAAX protease family)
MLSVKPWRAETVVQFGAALIFCICLGALVSGILRHLAVSGFKDLDDFGNILIGTLSFQGVIWLLAFIFLKLHHVGWSNALCFRGPQLKRALLLALIVFVVILPAAWLLQWASVTTLTKLGWPPAPQLAVQLFENADSWWKRAYLGVFAACLAPVAEEFVFRGVLYPFVKQLGWPRLAAFSVSFLFALIHFDVATFLPLFVLALALTWLYEQTDNLLAPILVHALFNGSNLVMLVLMHLNILPESQ